MLNDQVSEIKKIAILAMFSDSELLNELVLKGGNLLDIVYGIATRASLDLDFSIATDFKISERRTLGGRIRRVLGEAFAANGYHVFDVKVSKRPAQVPAALKHFWGGYRVEFKVIECERYDKLQGDPRALRLQACSLDKGSTKTFKIDISKHEYCALKRPREMEGRTLYVYTPEMVVFEKMRAICQQMREYSRPLGIERQSTARARDFFDVHAVCNSFKMDLRRAENKHLFESVFAAKRVPVKLVGKICDYRAYHSPDFDSVRDTLKPGHTLKDFDFYFDYVLEHCCKPLKPFWDI